MFGFSPTKILFTVILIAAVWYGFKIIGRIGAGKGAADEQVTKKDASAQEKKDASAQDMKKCPVCDAYVSAAAPANCGREDCPYSA
jgi:hypothetical protein